VAEAQLKQAGLWDFFEQALSADMARRLKPAREAYHLAPSGWASSPATSG
jgi:FMN phosphatase YigB (HAD superfamily)